MMTASTIDITNARIIDHAVPRQTNTLKATKIIPETNKYGAPPAACVWAITQPRNIRANPHRDMTTA